MITGDLIPTKGNVKRNMHLKISRFTQHFEEKLDLTMTPLDFFKQKLMPQEPIEKIRPLLGRYGCTGDQQSQVMSQLSAGQKARIVFAIIAHEKPHLLLLDEPVRMLLGLYLQLCLSFRAFSCSDLFADQPSGYGIN